LLTSVNVVLILATALCRSTAEPALRILGWFGGRGDGVPADDREPVETYDWLDLLLHGRSNLFPPNLGGAVPGLLFLALATCLSNGAGSFILNPAYVSIFSEVRRVNESAAVVGI